MNKSAFKYLVVMPSLFGMAALVVTAMPVFGYQTNPGDIDDFNQETPIPTPTPVTPPDTLRALEHIAAREAIPVETLVVVNQYRREYPMLGKAFWAVTALENNKDGEWYTVMIDLADGSFVDHIEAVEQAEEQARQAKYGKLEPALYERLKIMQPEDTLPVAVWIAGAPGRSQEELYAALADKYPEAKEALERSGKPFDVADHELMMQIKAEYLKMLGEDTQVQVEPLVSSLQAGGYSVTVFDAMPAVSAALPKSLILEMVSRSDVGAIYLIEEKENLDLDTAVPSDHVPVVWRSGFKGNGVAIAILEGGKVDFTGPQQGQDNYLHQGQVRSCSQGESWHKTWVASIAASYHGTYTGVAPEATIHDACADGSQSDTVLGLSWAVARADIVNASIGFEANGQMNFTDRAFDHYARNGNALITKSAGNRLNCGSNMYITSPGYGWNILTGGASDNKENSAWSDDDMWVDSCWVNPIGTDREKPELAAPGVNISAIELNRNLLPPTSGTSAAAPQVAGLAALLINRNSQLSAWPESLRAILMASATHNVDGPSGIPTGQDLKDGAGVIDAALADAIAKTRWQYDTTPCTGPCWWGIFIDNTNFPVGTYLNRYFNVSKGERVRVAVSWWSHADCPAENNCNYDRLDTDLNMGVKDPDGNWVSGAWSASWDNNYELVEFTAPKTGKYRIAVYKSRADESSNYLGIAWVKDATYLPDLRNKDGLVSEIFIRNDGAVARSVIIHYFDANGNPTPKGSDTCNLNKDQLCYIAVTDFNRIPAGTIGSAILDGGEDVSVAVRQRDSDNSPEVWAIYNGLTQPAGEAFVPLLHRNNSGWQSDLFIQNTGTGTASVSVDLKAETGSSCTLPTYSVPKNGLKIINLKDVTCVGSRFIGSARISSTQPVVAAATQHHLNASQQIDSLMESEHLGNPATSVFAPLIQNYNSNWITGLALQNASSSTNTLDVYFHNQGGSQCDPDTYSNVPAYHTRTDVLPPGNPPCSSIASARITGGALLVSLTVNQSLPGSLHTSDYPGVHNPGQAVTIALYFKQYNGLSSGIVVKNVSSSQSLTFTLNFYNFDGSWHSTPVVSQALNPNQIYWTNNLPGDGAFIGSAVLTASRPIAVQVNHFRSIPGDGLMSNIGIHR